MKILILGDGGHGKDKAAEIIRDQYGFRYQSSSMAACEEAVMPALAPIYGYTSIIECFEDRRSHRAEWKELISKYNTPDKARLAKKILTYAQCYVGMRCPLEYEASRDLFDIVIWVDASERRPPEPSMGIEYDDRTMFWLDNNGTIEQLAERIENMQLDIVRQVVGRHS